MRPLILVVLVLSSCQHFKALPQQTENCAVESFDPATLPIVAQAVKAALDKSTDAESYVALDACALQFGWKFVTCELAAIMTDLEKPTAGADGETIDPSTGWPIATRSTMVIRGNSWLAARGISLAK